MATNTRAYNQAVSGYDGPFEGAPSAIEFLRIHAVMNDADGGWATQVATTDASKKYAQALKVLHPAATIVAGTSKAIPVISGAPSVAPTPIAQTGTVNLPLVGTVATTPLIIAGVAALALVAITSNRGRR